MRWGGDGLTPQKLQLLGFPEHSDIVYVVVWLSCGGDMKMKCKCC